MEKNNINNQQMPTNENVQTASTPAQAANKTVNKSKGLKGFLERYYSIMDQKTKKLITDDKLRKLVIMAVSVFALIFIFIFLLGILVSLTRPRNIDIGYTLNKPVIPTSTPKAESPKTKTQEKLNELKTQINKLSFPASTYAPPTVITDIKITEEEF